MKLTKSEVLKQDIQFVIVVMVFFGLFFLGVVTFCHADSEYENSSYFARFQREKALVQAEISRRHELEIERAKIEVLGKLQELEATQINNIVSANASSDSKVSSRVSQTNS